MFKSTGIGKQQQEIIFLSGYGFDVSRIMRVSLFLCLPVVLLLLSSCVGTGKGGMDENVVNGAMVYYTEREPGSEPFKTRIFVSKDHVHISDDRTQNDFILFDRREKTIYNINAADKTIMVIKSKKVTEKPPIDIDYQEVSQPSGAIPQVGGKSATHYRYTANDKHCYDVVSLGADFIPELSIAMSEFRQVLAGEHAKTVGATPRELLDACDLALNIYHAADHLKHGFPLREWDRNGFSRFIIYYREKDKMQKKFLELPEGYERYSISANKKS